MTTDNNGHGNKENCIFCKIIRKEEPGVNIYEVKFFI